VRTVVVGNNGDRWLGGAGLMMTKTGNLQQVIGTS
jgi:hypothetical protein